MGCKEGEIRESCRTRLTEDLAVHRQQAVGGDSSEETGEGPERGDEEELEGRAGLLLRVPREVPNVACEGGPGAHALKAGVKSGTKER